MTADGFDYQTYALAAHGLAALQQGTVEVLGVLPDDSASISETTAHIMWRNYKAWPSQEDEDYLSHSCFLSSVPRTFHFCCFN
eukprot:956779-Pyramimonas_sp.AAC.1